MGRTATLAVGLLLALTACGTTETGEPNGVDVSSTTSVTPTTTTTTEADPCAGEPFSIDERGMRLAEGCEYRTEDFAMPVGLTAPSDDWLSFAVPDPRVVYLGIDQDRDGAVEANIAIISNQAGTEDDPFSGVLAIKDEPYGVESVSSPTATTVDGREALTLDVLGEEKFELPGRSGCTTTGVRYFGGDVGDGYRVGPAGSPTDSEYGIPACVRTRVWQLAIVDVPLTIVAAALDNDRFAEFMPIFEEFLQDSVTFGGGDG